MSTTCPTSSPSGVGGENPSVVETPPQDEEAGGNHPPVVETPQDEEVGEDLPDASEARHSFARPGWFPKFLDSINAYPTMNAQGTGFDPTERWLGALCTIFAKLIAVGALVWSAIDLANTHAVETFELDHPSYNAYLEVMQVDGLVRHPDCQCYNTIHSFSKQHGGFVSDLNVTLDAICDLDLGYLRGSCPSALQSSHNCAMIEAGLQYAHDALSGYCEKAFASARTHTEDFMMESVVSHMMLSQRELEQLVTANLRRSVQKMRMEMNTKTAKKNPLTEDFLDSEMLLNDILAMSFYTHDPCFKYTINSTDGTATHSNILRSVLEQCREGEFWEGQCCNYGSCTEREVWRCDGLFKHWLLVLARSSYSSLDEVFEQGALKRGMESFVVQDTCEEMHSTYFNRCEPYRCTYITKTKPTFKKLSIVLVGLVGGFLAMGGTVGGVALMIAKQFSHRCS